MGLLELVGEVLNILLLRVLKLDVLVLDVEYGRHVAESLVVRVPIHILVEHVLDHAELLLVPRGLQHVEHLKESLNCEHAVRPRLMHGALARDPQNICNF